MQPDAPSTPPPAGADAAPGFDVHAYPLVARAMGGALRLISAVNILFLALRILTDIFVGAEGASPIVVVRNLLLFSLLPGLASWLLGLLARARVTVEPGQLVVRTRGARYEIPWESLAPEGVRPSWLPWPEPGLTLRMRSGRSFRLHLALRDPTPLLKRLTKVEGHARLGQAALVHPMVAWAYARSRHDARRWRRLGIKFGLFPLLPTGVMFRTHQYIAYGGTFGEYYLLGLKAYLKTLLGYWSGVVGYLLVYAGIWRGFGEIVTFALAWVAPARATAVRRAVEIICALVYYVGFPLLVLARFLA